ncbi:AAA family ATPase [Shinella sp. 838]|uniref:AAA family ATPase n=1 Tax=Shinella sp. 838 TaxID=3038164 RepID=UPI0024156247|nr:AAA family ATPase [Shinella sp. 838]MDG4670891.1 AAA family ATPase [Shinella sp. 838]
MASILKQLETNLDDLRGMSAPLATNTDSREKLVLGVYDRLLDHGHATVNVVLAPALPDGSPDFGHADPTNLEALPADEWPEDPQVAKRVSILIDQIDGCDPATSMLLFFTDFGDPVLEQIAGPEADGDIAMRIVGRDIGARPPESAPTPLSQSMAKLREELFQPVAANDNVAPAAKKLFTVISPADFADAPVPSRKWYIEELIPARNVTLLSGDGGTGKSLVALQIAVAGCLGAETLGLAPAFGRTLVLAAEDEWDELHRRLDDICVAQGTTLAALRGMRVIPAAGQDAELVRADAKGRIQFTNKMEALVDEIVDFQPSLVVLDTSADLFGGNEIDRNQVRFFISALRGLAMELDCTFLLLSHPSVAGMQTGTGISGSTAWNNSVRSRLYLTADKEDDDARVMKGMKANYGRKGGEIRMRWQGGIFVLDDGRPAAGSVLLAARAERVFVETLAKLFQQGQRLSPSPSATYAVKIIAAHPDAKGLSKKELVAAQQRLLDSGSVRIVEEGSPSRRTKHLIVVDDQPSD